MIVIDEVKIEAIEKHLTFSPYLRKELLIDKRTGPPLRKYLTLTDYRGSFSEYDDLTVYYNRYYWFLCFLDLSVLSFGDDDGLRQQEFMLYEEGESYENIDWQEMEQISAQAKNNFG